MSDPPPSRREQRILQAAGSRIGSVCCIIEGMDDGGDRAAVLRTAESLGFLHVHEVQTAARRAHQANAGEKWLHVHKHETAEECVTAVRALGYTLCVFADFRGSAATEESLVPIERLDFTRPVALVFGGGGGVSATTLDAAQCLFTVPLCGADLDDEPREVPGVAGAPCTHGDAGRGGLDMSVSVALALHWARIQRVAALRTQGALSAGGGDLDAAALAELLESYRARGRGFKRDHRRAVVARQARTAA